MESQIQNSSASPHYCIQVHKPYSIRILFLFLASGVQANPDPWAGTPTHEEQRLCHSLGIVCNLQFIILFRLYRDCQRDAMPPYSESHAMTTEEQLLNLTQICQVMLQAQQESNERLQRLELKNQELAEDVENQRFINESQTRAYAADRAELSRKLDQQRLQLESRVEYGKELLRDQRANRELCDEILEIYTESKIFNLQHRSFISLLKHDSRDIIRGLQLESPKSRLHVIKGGCATLYLARGVKVYPKLIRISTSKEITAKAQRELDVAFRKHNMCHDIAFTVHFAVEGEPDCLGKDLFDLAEFLQLTMDGKPLVDTLRMFPSVKLVISKVKPSIDGKHKVGFLNCFLESDAVLSSAVRLAKPDSFLKQLLDLEIDISSIKMLSHLWTSVSQNLINQKSTENSIDEFALLQDGADENHAAANHDERPAQLAITNITIRRGRSRRSSVRSPSQTCSSRRPQGTWDPVVATTPTSSRKSIHSAYLKADQSAMEPTGATALRKKKSSSRQPRVVAKAKLSPKKGSAAPVNLDDTYVAAPITPDRRSGASMKSQCPWSSGSGQSEYDTAASSTSEESLLGHR